MEQLNLIVQKWRAIWTQSAEITEYNYKNTFYIYYPNSFLSSYILYNYGRLLYIHH